MTATLTADDIAAHKPCASHLQKFRAAFGDACTVASEEDAIAAVELLRFDGVDVHWAERLLSDPALAEYRKARDAAWAEYRKVSDPTLAEYRKVRDPTLARALYQQFRTV